MYMMNRWGVFITNLYGTAIYIGWMSVLIGFFVELIYRNGIGTFVAGAAGFMTMIIAQYLAMGEDTMEMMRAVLDTNFWLATHVTTVNTGYAGTLFAGLLGGVFVLWALLRRGKASRTSKCSATFSTASSVSPRCLASRAPCWAASGPISRGADSGAGIPRKTAPCSSSFGTRLILHARWGGMVKQRGMAVLALMGNIIVIWSWWGVNMLGVGLHAYANADPGMLTTVKCAVAIHLVVIAIGLTPRSLWVSYNAPYA